MEQIRTIFVCACARSFDHTLSYRIKYLVIKIFVFIYVCFLCVRECVFPFISFYVNVCRYWHFSDSQKLCHRFRLHRSIGCFSFPLARLLPICARPLRHHIHYPYQFRLSHLFRRWRPFSVVVCVDDLLFVCECK